MNITPEEALAIATLFCKHTFNYDFDTDGSHLKRDAELTADQIMQGSMYRDLVAIYKLGQQSMPVGIVKFEGELTEDQVEEFKRKFNNQLTDENLQHSRQTLLRPLPQECDNPNHDNSCGTCGGCDGGHTCENPKPCKECK